MSKRMELPPSTIIMHIALPDHHPYGMSATCTNYRIAPMLRLAYCTLEHCTPIANHLERNYGTHLTRRSISRFRTASCKQWET